MKAINLLVDFLLVVTASFLALLAIPPGIAAAALILMSRTACGMTSNNK